MTTQVGTFIPLQGQNAGWGSNGLNQHTNWGLAGWNQNPGWNQQAGWNQNPGWNPNAGWNHTASQHPHNGSLLLLTTPGLPYGINNGENIQGLSQHGSHVALIPNHGSIGGGFLPTNLGLQGLGGTAVVGIPAPFQGGQHTGNGLGHSFATELSENNHEYVISFDVPGIEIGDLDISLSGSTILINGIRKGTHDMATLAYSEIARGTISRAIAVPFDVSPNKAINTSLENGVLKIRIAKESHSDKKMTARKVKIG